MCTRMVVMGCWMSSVILQHFLFNLCIQVIVGNLGNSPVCQRNTRTECSWRTLPRFLDSKRWRIGTDLELKISGRMEVVDCCRSIIVPYCCCSQYFQITLGRLINLQLCQRDTGTT